jgi:hypothetical protein
MKRISIGAILLLVGAVSLVVSTADLVWSALDRDRQQFLAPGEELITIDDEGKYYIYHDFETTFAGRRYRSAKELPEDWEIEIVNPETGAPVAVWVSGVNISEHVGQNSRVAVGAVELTSGTYRVVMSGEGETRVMSIAKGYGGMIRGGLLLLASAILIVPVTFILGLFLIAWGVYACIKKRSRVSEDEEIQRYVDDSRPPGSA